MSKLLSKFKANPKMDYGDFMMFFAELHVEKIQYGGRTDLCKFVREKLLPETDFWKKIDLMTVYFEHADPPAAYDRLALSNPTLDVND